MVDLKHVKANCMSVLRSKSQGSNGKVIESTLMDDDPKNPILDATTGIVSVNRTTSSSTSNSNSGEITYGELSSMGVQSTPQRNSTRNTTNYGWANWPKPSPRLSQPQVMEVDAQLVMASEPNADEYVPTPGQAPTPVLPRAASASTAVSGEMSTAPFNSPDETQRTISVVQGMSRTGSAVQLMSRTASAGFMDVPAAEMTRIPSLGFVLTVDEPHIQVSPGPRVLQVVPVQQWSQDMQPINSQAPIAYQAVPQSNAVTPAGTTVLVRNGSGPQLPRASSGGGLVRLSSGSLARTFSAGTILRNQMPDFDLSNIDSELKDAYAQLFTADAQRLPDGRFKMPKQAMEPPRPLAHHPQVARGSSPMMVQSPFRHPPQNGRRSPTPVGPQQQASYGGYQNNGYSAVGAMPQMPRGSAPITSQPAKYQVRPALAARGPNSPVSQPPVVPSMAYQPFRGTAPTAYM